MESSEPINARDASQIAAGGCIIGAPIALVAIFKWALKSVESKEHAMAHQVEEVELEARGGNEATFVPAAESLTRFLATLRRVTAPFDKMGARFEPANYEMERKKLDSIKKRFEAEADQSSSEAKTMLAEAEQLLARYAPQ